MIEFLRKFADENGLLFEYTDDPANCEIVFRFTNPRTNKCCGHRVRANILDRCGVDALAEIVRYTEKELLKENA